jgi:diaminohydroxyphosphoribosylaminopyrimidine deaminase/5-amino-6-(5-phosphoribosylamino)uracil reductase
MNKDKDWGYLEMAYSLAQKARGWVSPNPHVGAVIVKKGAIIGYGHHAGPGHPHAESVALKRAGSSARGSSLYLTLEPCTHWGRTPPCIDSVLAAKPKRVVISDYDANPQVKKKGIRSLREHGIEVDVGILKEKNRVLNEAYIKFITQKLPFVTLKAGISLDGKMATKTLCSKWISSPQTREYTHLLRGESDAIMTGISTIIADDPELTIRDPFWEEKTFLRIVLDPQLRIPLTAKILKKHSKGKTVLFTKQSPSSPKSLQLKIMNVDVISQRGSGRNINLRQVLSWLGKNGIASLLVEGGGKLHSSFLDSRLADKMVLAVSPKLIGGKNAPELYQGKGIESLEESLRLKKLKTFEIENDVIFEGYI